MTQAIDRLINNSPCEEPQHYWNYDRETRSFNIKDGRRPAGYVVASESSKAFDDPGIFIEIPLVKQIRARVSAWREHPTNPYAGVAGITKRLLEHWHNPEEREYRRFFFCQLEAIETLIWLTESPDAEKGGYRDTNRWRSISAYLLQDGYRFRQDNCYGNAHRMADFEQGYLSSG